MNLTAANTRCANAKTLASTIYKGMNRLKINIPTALTHVVGVAYPVPKLRAATADFTNFCHIEKRQLESNTDRASYFTLAEPETSATL